jgi:chromosome partitioning ATPase
VEQEIKKEGKVISVINMKGGVGKTSISTGISDFLANNNYNILFIDIDPQYNGTQTLLTHYKDEDFYQEILDSEKTICKLFQAKKKVGEANLVPDKEEIIVELKENFDIICGDLNLITINNSIETRLSAKLDKFIEKNNLKNIYDFIIIDCPPTLTIYTDSALIASDYYFIPNKIDRYSIIGIDLLQEAIKDLINDNSLKLECIGLVYTLVDERASPVKQERLRNVFESKDIVKEIEIFNSKFRYISSMCLGEQGPLATLYKTSNEDIESITSELIKKIEERR